VIYFLKAEQDGAVIQAGWIKIGCTVRLSVRVKQIAAEIGHIPTVLAVLDGGFAEERALHRKFDFAEKFREWFYPDPELLLLIETDGRPWDGTDEVPSALIALKCRQEFKDWVSEFARKLRTTPSQLVDRALTKLAEVEGFKEPPER
jgi:hypothetical protein